MLMMEMIVMEILEVTVVELDLVLVCIPVYLLSRDYLVGLGDVTSTRLDG